MAVVVKDTNVPRYKAVPMGSALPKTGGPFKQNASIFGGMRPREAVPAPARSEPVPAHAEPSPPPVHVAPPRIRVMANAAPDPVQIPPAEPVFENDGFLGQESAEVPPAQNVSVAGTIVLIAVGVGLVILLSN